LTVVLRVSVFAGRILIVSLAIVRLVSLGGTSGFENDG
jgi:hypothetical protein